MDDVLDRSAAAKNTTNVRDNAMQKLRSICEGTFLRRSLQFNGLNYFNGSHKKTKVCSFSSAKRYILFYFIYLFYVECKFKTKEKPILVIT